MMQRLVGYEAHGQRTDAHVTAQCHMCDMFGKCDLAFSSVKLHVTTLKHSSYS